VRQQAQHRLPRFRRQCLHQRQYGIPFDQQRPIPSIHVAPYSYEKICWFTLSGDDACMIPRGENASNAKFITTILVTNDVYCEN
jgi:hypothetical protein